MNARSSRTALVASMVALALSGVACGASRPRGPLGPPPEYETPDEDATVGVTGDAGATRGDGAATTRP